jgi:hypothetical protein
MKSDEKRVQALEAESTIAVQGRQHPKTPGSKLLRLKRSKKTHRQTDTHSLSLALALSEEEEVVELRVYRLKTQTEHIIHNAANTQCCTLTTQNQFKHELVAVLPHPRTVTFPNAKRLHSLALRYPLLFSSLLFSSL